VVHDGCMLNAPKISLAALLVLFAGCGDDSATPGGGSPGGGGSSSSSPNTGGGGTTSDGGSGAGTNEGGAGGEGGSEPMGAGLPGGPSSDRLTVKPLGTVAGAEQGFWEYLPPSYGNGAKFPLLMFYHGIGENGDGSEGALNGVLNTGLPALLKNDEWPEAQPFVILSTQHPGGGCHSDGEISGFLSFAMASYDIDPARVYITGLSCGAIGGWGYLGNHTNEVVAAAVLIAGDGNGAFNQAGCSLGTVPIWALHGDADGVVNVNGSINPINNLNDCTDPAPVEAKLTLYPGVGHNSWDMTYDPEGPNDIYSWMLGYTNP